MKIRLSKLKNIIREEVSRAVKSLSEAEFSRSPHWSNEYGHIQMPKNIGYIADFLKEYVDDLLASAVADPTTESVVRSNLKEVFKELLKSGSKPMSVVKQARLDKEARSLTMKALEHIEENLEELSERLREGTDRVRTVEDLVFQIFTRHQSLG